jgi:hypothetical protein
MLYRVIELAIAFKPLNKEDKNYDNVLALYKASFPGAQYIPTCLLRFKLRHGKDGFSVIYDDENWVGLLYFTRYKDIVFVQFFSIAEATRSMGYGSEVLAELARLYVNSRLVLNIELLDDTAENNEQRIKRKSFYERNGFTSTGFAVKEGAEFFEMLIMGGNIEAQEIEAMYQSLMGKFGRYLVRPQVRKIKGTITDD